MGKQLISDFVVETNGQCFLCLRRTASTNESYPFQRHSLQFLSRYLEMDMRKVFVEERAIPQHLLESVQKSKLKVELCEGCVVINDKFSGLFRKLEKIEMEVKCCLDGVYRKLERAVNSGKIDHRTQHFNNSEDERLTAKLEIAEALRKDAMQKCSLKLATARPLAKLEKLTLTQVNQERLKIRRAANLRFMQSSESNYEINRSPVSSSLSIEDDNDYVEEQNHSIGSPIPVGEYVHGLGTVKQEHVEKSSPVPDQPYFADMTRSGGVSETKAQKDLNAGTIKNEGKLLTQTIPAPMKIDGEVETDKLQRRLNPETGKYKCLICSEEYSDVGQFDRHYKTAHLKVRYKCGLCAKDFPRQENYRKHYLSIHMCVKFKCSRCNKTFKQKTELIQHQKSAHLGRKYECSYCHKLFNSRQSRFFHVKTGCPQRSSSQSAIE